MIVHNVTRKAQCITIISPALVLLLKHRIHLDSIVVFFLPEGFFLFCQRRANLLWSVTLIFDPRIYIAIWSARVSDTPTLENSWIKFFLLYCYHELVMIKVALAECSSKDRLIVTLSISNWKGNELHSTLSFDKLQIVFIAQLLIAYIPFSFVPRHLCHVTLVSV